MGGGASEIFQKQAGKQRFDRLKGTKTRGNHVKTSASNRTFEASENAIEGCAARIVQRVNPMESDLNQFLDFD
jgi:hypothetical protein